MVRLQRALDERHFVPVRRVVGVQPGHPDAEIIHRAFGLVFRHVPIHQIRRVRAVELGLGQNADQDDAGQPLVRAVVFRSQMRPHIRDARGGGKGHQEGGGGQ